MVFLPVRAGNLHDPPYFGRPGRPRCTWRGASCQNAGGKIGQKRRLSLIISCLSYAFSALLRRNIVAFQTPEQAYFPN
jgi:hypothetical protein